MPLPTTISYVAPAPDRANRAPWVLDPDRAALLVHDMQHYFVRPYHPACPALVAAVDGTARLIAAARERGMPIVYTAQPGNQDPRERGLLTGLWGPGITARAEDVDIIDALRPAPEDTVLVKHRYSAFVRTGLEEWLTVRGRDQLLVTGVYGHIGVLASATDALMLDVEPFVVSDGIADFSAEDHARALTQTASLGGVVTTVHEVLRALAATGGATAGATSGVTEAAAVTDWAGWLAGRLGELLGDATLGRSLVETPEQDLFEAGLDSLRCFELLDDLADHGIDVDFADLTSAGSTAFLLGEIHRRLQDQPAAVA